MQADSQFPLIQILVIVSSPPTWSKGNRQRKSYDPALSQDAPNAINTARRTALWFVGIPMVAV